MNINERGFWENPTTEGHGHDEGLAYGILLFLRRQLTELPINMVWDIGCGDGFYTQFLNRRSEGYIYCTGIDGNPYTKNIAGEYCIILDLSKKVELAPKDWSICLEVGEHVPQEFETVFLDNICHLSKKGLILSWAVKGQGGDGHVNCLNNDEVIERMSSRNFYLDGDATQELRSYCAEYPNTGWWFKQTLMVFRKADQFVHKDRI